jgi:hypothetical protein
MTTVHPAVDRPTREQLTYHHVGSTRMYSMHEALARDRMREQEQRSREQRLVRELAAQRRWHRVSRHARAAELRHARRAQLAPVR